MPSLRTALQQQHISCIYWQALAVLQTPVKQIGTAATAAAAHTWGKQQQSQRAAQQPRELWHLPPQHVASCQQQQSRGQWALPHSPQGYFVVSHRQQQQQNQQTFTGCSSRLPGSFCNSKASVRQQPQWLVCNEQLTGIATYCSATLHSAAAYSSNSSAAPAPDSSSSSSSRRCTICTTTAAEITHHRAKATKTHSGSSSSSSVVRLPCGGTCEACQDTLISSIRSSSTMQELNTLVDQYSNNMQPASMVAAIIQASKLLHSTPQQQGGLQDACSNLMQQLWQLSQQQLSSFEPKQLANIIHAILSKAPAAIRQQYQAPVMQQLLPAFVQQLQQAQPQDISTVLHAAAVGVKQPISFSEAKTVQQYLSRLVVSRSSATPQDIARSLWAVSSLFVAHPGRVLPLRPMAKQLQLLLQELAEQADSAQIQDGSMTLLACARWGYLPVELLLNTKFAGTLTGQLIHANTQQLANMAWSLGQLGHRDEQLMGQILQQVQLQLQDDPAAFKPQELVNTAWAAAVLDLQQFADVAVDLAATYKQQWQHISHSGILDRHLRQLYQVHWWLADIQYGDKSGLAGTLTPQQLQQCKAVWDSLLQPLTSRPGSAAHRSVLAALKQLPVQWQQPPKYEMLSADGLLLVDITATTAHGQWSAIEVDGPSHFRWRDNEPTGPTLWRNRALAARGYTVVSIPYYEWEGLTVKQRQQYLLDKLQAVK